MIKKSILILALSVIVVGCGARKRSARNVSTKLEKVKVEDIKEAETKRVEVKEDARKVKPIKANINIDFFIM